MEIGAKIKQAREAQGLTQAELAAALNLSRSAVSGWEVGRNFPDIATLIQLCDLFDLSLDQLLREETTMVKELDKRIQFSQRAKKLLWLSASLVLLVVLLGGGFTFWKDYQAKQRQPILVTDFIDLDLQLVNEEGKEAPRLTGKVQLLPGYQLALQEAWFNDQILYLRMTQEPAFGWSKKSTPLDFKWELSLPGLVFDGKSSSYNHRPIKTVKVISDSEKVGDQGQQERIIYQQE